MENNLEQSIANAWDALTGKKSLPVQIVSLLALAFVSVFAVFIVLLVANWWEVSGSFFRLLEILLSPTVIICALVLYLWQRHEARVDDNILGSIVKTWNAAARKISPSAQIALLLLFAFASIFVVLLVANWLEVTDAFLSLLGILFSPTVVICALVLYMCWQYGTHIGDFLNRVIVEVQVGKTRIKLDPAISDPAVYSRSKSDNNFGTSLPDTETSSGSPNIEEIEKKAERGDDKAQSALGFLYYSGIEVAQDHTEAHKWLDLAAKQKNAEAQSNLGVLYDNGEGVAQDHDKAAEYFRLAAKQGNAEAQFNLGTSYYNGRGVKQDHDKAVKCFRLAAKQGNAEAQFNLGVLYYDGEGVAQDHDKAAEYFRLAAEQGHVRAQFNLGVSYHNGNGVAQNYSEAYIWLSLASAGNHSGARKARDQVAQKLDSDAMKNAQAEATRRAEKIRRKREGESQ